MRAGRRGHGLPRRRAGLARVRALRPAAGARGRGRAGLLLLGRPRGRRARRPRRALRPQRVRGGQGLRRRPRLLLRATAPLPHPRRRVPGHLLQSRPLVLRRHARRLLHPSLAGAGSGGGRLRPARRPASGAHHLRPLRRRRCPGVPRRRVRAATGVVHRGGPRRLRLDLPQVRLPVPSQDVQVSAQDAVPAGRQVPSPRVDGDGREGLLQARRLRGRCGELHGGPLRAGREDGLHPGREPLRAGAAA
ncbi:hypothetical protein GQ55_3G392700 [Panicum hallii var. hallii]|uniref:Uncharacterized protein n=1 Tax=Panicum hallii var. hallii TaxID=1504633 RepID=A0A2T7EGM4_9POAL|nr:hypothetical protein GQ55_3G392700 [Panicum hallii var. hallii]